ncbi:lipid asymmetry maintenance protein MlaB [Serratia sp. Tan611]|uniref:lipid asymmetry maintenance protein MlaB n=1 Tax=Serratia sp. Tan611 TaxID=2773264 RepID=UPI0018D6DAA4|nr:lipid asymmetry maintenance protein MlaB [Serratia sp. Tan611]QPT13231.1 lipid asymmetry maintenance protein MlaB [Serratia rubidaea]CAE1150578.1 Intermembrane phospholipid transport system binding protein MlaB [Serratia sp. Tan611]
MAESLRFDDQQQTLVLHGDLDRETLLPLWRQRAKLLKGKTAIDVAQLRRVDSSGLALLVHLRAEQLRNGVELKISGATDRLRTLIALYNLQEIMPVETRS